MKEHITEQEITLINTVISAAMENGNYAIEFHFLDNALYTISLVPAIDPPDGPEDDSDDDSAPEFEYDPAKFPV